MNNEMTPVFADAPVLIPTGNMRDDIPGTYGWYQKELAKNKKRPKNYISSIPNFKTGFMSQVGTYEM